LIPIVSQPEPQRFAQDVRLPGNAFLRRVRSPTKTDWEVNRYWTKALPDLYSSYGRICAYSASWIPAAVQASVDHFRPKANPTYRHLAFEWTNYRLSSKEMNSYKGNDLRVLDPFSIQHGWFVLRMDTFYIEAQVGLRQQLIDAIKHTIKTLRLNHEAFIDSRYAILKDYSNGECTIGFLQRHFPFIAYELQRQNLTTSILGTIR